MDKEPVQRPSTTSASTKRHALSSPQTEDGDVPRKRQRLDIPEFLHHVRKPDIQQSLLMVINFINDKLESQERHFNHKLAEQETRWQTRFENLESKWVGKLALAELEDERSKTRVMSIEMDLRERVGRLEGALAVLLRQSQGMPIPMSMGLSSTDYPGVGNPGALIPNGVATRGDLEQTLMPIWSSEQAIDDLYEQEVVKSQRQDSVVGDQIVVERQGTSLSMGADDEVDTTLSERQHHHANSYFHNPEDDPILPTVSPQALIPANFTMDVQLDSDDHLDHLEIDDGEHNTNDLWLSDHSLSSMPSPSDHPLVASSTVAEQGTTTTTTVSTPLVVDIALAPSSHTISSSSPDVMVAVTGAAQVLKKHPTCPTRAGSVSTAVISSNIKDSRNRRSSGVRKIDVSDRIAYSWTIYSPKIS
ncbi:hypothetical protein D1P53_006092 [Cryptococcus gattii VGV]|nr:hypothetical protein D1P53_006092 [Cryptococcus gattii VGV]